MNDKMVNIISAGLILYFASWFHKSTQVSLENKWTIIVAVFIIGVVARVVAAKKARNVVQNRSTVYREIRRRLDSNMSITKNEEDLIALKGRIIGSRITAFIFIVGGGVAIYYHRDLLVLVLGLGNLFLSSRLYMISKKLGDRFPRDYY